MFRKSLIVAAGLSLAIAGSALAGTLTKGLEITGGENAFTRVALERADNGETDGLIRLHMTVEEAKALKGYGFTVKYDETRYEFVEAKQVGEGLLGAAEGNAGLFVSSNKNPGEIVVGSMKIDGNSADGSGQLVEFVFRSTEDPLPSDFTVLEGVLVDLAGNVDRIANVEIGRLGLLPDNYGLDQNIPNPFNPSTNIAYQIPDAGRVQLVIYNLLGQEVRKLVDQNLEAGFHTVVWDGADNYGRQVASGVYIYRMKANDFSQTKRMMLLK